MRGRHITGVISAFLAGVLLLAGGCGRKQPRSSELTICSFNIQFLGSFKDRDNTALAEMLSDYDIVAVQELVAPPVPGTYPDGSAYLPDIEAKAFFDAMTENRFDYLLSEEDTGTGETIHTAGTATEWWAVFYKPEAVVSAPDLPSGFLAEDRSNHEDFERVPCAFPFRSADGNLDFVLIPVHLKPDKGSISSSRRKHELAAIHAWIEAHNATEKDFIILGDMNIYNRAELDSLVPPGFISLNDECRITNTNQPAESKGFPYDHVMVNPAFTAVDEVFDFQVVDLIREMRSHWISTAAYLGDPYVHNEFRQHYSDHHPVVFRLVVSEDRD